MQNLNERQQFLVVNNVRYVRPYIRQEVYSLRPKHVEGTAVVDIMVGAFGRSRSDAKTYMTKEVLAGRVELLRHRRFRGDEAPFTSWTKVADPEMPTEKGDRLRITKHIHERATIFRGEIDFLWSNNVMAAVYKPAGLPVVDDIGGYSTVTGLLPGKGWRAGHRLDLPVQGILLVGKGK